MRFLRKGRAESSYAFFVGGPAPTRGRFFWVVSTVVPVFIGFFVLIAAGFLWLRADIPSTDVILTHQPSLASYVYDSGGRRIGSFASERRRLLSISKISPHMQQAIVAVEDERFYKHRGIDPLGILRAAWRNLLRGGISQGGSTLTQQLVRLLVLGRERTLKRKLIEAIVAVRLEMTLTKDEILERYLNLVYFGRGAYGVAAAARTYFNKNASDLSPAEAALLAGLVQAPGRYKPFADPGPSLSRRSHVLRRMAAVGYLKPGEADRISRSSLGLCSPRQVRLGGYFLEYVRREVEETYGSEALYRGGLRICTTMTVEHQRAAERAVRSGVDRLIRRRWPKRGADPEWHPPEGALLALAPATGAIRAMVGGVDFQKSKFNRAVQALRQPGSSFKPIVYAAAIDMGFTPVDPVLDAPIVMGEGSGRPAWKPQNYGKNFKGQLSLRDALAASRNTVSVRLVQEVGLRRLVGFARLLGIRSPIEPNMASALGSSVTTLREMIAAYGVFANGGSYNEPYAIKKVENSRGEVLFRHSSSSVRAIRPEVAYVITHMLKGVVERGTAQGAEVLGRPIAGKTGTTNDFRDNWFIGYTPDLVVGVWLGFDLPKRLGSGETGGKNAVPIFVDYLRDVTKGVPSEDFVPPPGVEFVRVDRDTGLLATRKSRRAEFEAFLRGTSPTRSSDSEGRRTEAIFRAEGAGRPTPATGFRGR